MLPNKRKANEARLVNCSLYCFQDSGVSRLLYNSRVQVNTSDGVPIEIANSHTRRSGKRDK